MARRGSLVLVFLAMVVSCSKEEAPAVTGPGSPDGLPPLSEAPVDQRLVVLHVPGLDPDLVERWRADLPNLERLSPGRPLTRLQVDVGAAPAQIAAQVAVGKALMRPDDLRGPLLDPASMSMGAAAPPGAKAAPYWERAASAGVVTRALWVDQGLPERETPGLFVVPDRVASPLLAATTVILLEGAPAPADSLGGAVLRAEGPGPWSVPVPLTDGSALPLEIAAQEEGRYRVSIGGTRVDVQVGELGLPLTVPLATGAGGIRLRVAVMPGGDGHLLSLIGPGAVAGPGLAAASPAAFADEWAVYHDAIDTSGGGGALVEALGARLIHADHLLAALETQLVRHGEILVEELGRQDAGLVVARLPEAGQAAMAFIGYSDPNHPAWKPDVASAYGGVPKQFYMVLDDVVGRVRKALGPKDRLLLVSEHGIATVHSLVDLNAALADARLLAPPASRPARVGFELPLRDVQVWATGSGYLFVNDQSRFSQGLLPPAKARAAATAAARSLSGLSAQRRPVVASVEPGTVLPQGLEGPWRPDLVVRLAEGAGFSTNTRHGAVGAAAVTPNTSAITGGPGRSTPEDLGFVSASFGQVPPVRDLDLAPTVLALLGVAVPEDLTGTALRVGYDGAGDEGRRGP